MIYPAYLEEAFLLLGYSKVQVGCFIFNDPLHPFPMTIIPSLDGKCVISKGARQYPNWMNQSLFIPRGETVVLNENSQKFLLFYPEMRNTLARNSYIVLSLMRFVRAIKSRLFNDIILELVIGIESLLTEGASDASLQFRLNISWLIGINYEDRVLIEKFSKILYTMRSKIVHEGGKVKSVEKEYKKIGDKATLQTVTNFSINLYRMIFLRMIEAKQEKFEFIGRDYMISEIKKARLGGDMNINSIPLFDSSYSDFINHLRSLYS